MAGASLQLDIRQVDVSGALPLLQALSAEAKDMTEVMDEIGAALVTSTRHRFETQPSPAGRAWEPPARAQAQSGQTLVDTGRLRDSITHAPAARTVEVGTNVIYAGIHQFGGPIRRGGRQVGTMPERPFLGLDQDDEAELTAIVADAFARAGR